MLINVSNQILKINKNYLKKINIINRQKLIICSYFNLIYPDIGYI